MAKLSNTKKETPDVKTDEHKTYESILKAWERGCDTVVIDGGLVIRIDEEIIKGIKERLK